MTDSTDETSGDETLDDVLDDGTSSEELAQCRAIIDRSSWRRSWQQNWYARISALLPEYAHAEAVKTTIVVT
jgi:hypothetical protein